MSHLALAGNVQLQGRQSVRRLQVARVAVVLVSLLLFMKCSLACVTGVEPSVARGGALRCGLGSRVTEAVDTRGLGTRISEIFQGKFVLDDYLRSQKRKVEAALDSSVDSTTPYNAKITEAMRYSLMAGGKRIRPIMCLAGYEMIAGDPDLMGGADKAAMPLGVALEMIHTMSLMHDDLPALDNDDLRRGKPTSHKVYGENVAILAGDALLSEAFTHIAAATPKSIPAERVLDVIRRLGRAVGNVGLNAGQVLDLECEAKQCATLEELQWIHEHKTGALLEVAVVGGAVLAGATEAEIAACAKYARDIGLAFQVADDILDVTQTSEELGKTAGKDEAVDKTTYVKLLGLEGAKAKALQLKEEAIESLSQFGARAAPLVAIAEYIVKRSN